MRVVVQAFCLSLVLTLVPAAAAEAVSAKTLTTCRTYNTHKMCVILRRSTDGKVWATAYLDKLSGRSNLRYVSVRLYSRACQASNWTTRDHASDDPVWGDRTARATTESVVADNQLIFKANVAGAWMRGRKTSDGGTVIKNRHDRIIGGKSLHGSGCD